MKDFQRKRNDHPHLLESKHRNEHLSSASGGTLVNPSLGTQAFPVPRFNTRLSPSEKQQIPVTSLALREITQHRALRSNKSISFTHLLPKKPFFLLMIWDLLPNSRCGFMCYVIKDSIFFLEVSMLFHPYALIFQNLHQSKYYLRIFAVQHLHNCHNLCH